MSSTQTISVTVLFSSQLLHCTQPWASRLKLNVGNWVKGSTWNQLLKENAGILLISVQPRSAMAELRLGWIMERGTTLQLAEPQNIAYSFPFQGVSIDLVAIDNPALAVQGTSAAAGYIAPMEYKGYVPCSEYERYKSTRQVVRKGCRLL
jgi:hypothetical protein